ncbi:hypothetical protein [Paenibacillus periandrae]|nr:hypothetical protein [Paenibacillus periandrae]
MKKVRFDPLYQTKFRYLIRHRGKVIGVVYTLRPYWRNRGRYRV